MANIWVTTISKASMCNCSRRARRKPCPCLRVSRRRQAFWELAGWYPDSTRFIADVGIPGKPISLWSVPILGGAPQELAEDVGGGRVSAYGSSLAFLKVPNALGAREIWLRGAHGESPHRLLTAGEQSGFGRVAWSPAGSRIAYRYTHQESD